MDFSIVQIAKFPLNTAVLAGISGAPHSLLLISIYWNFNPNFVSSLSATNFFVYDDDDDEEDDVYDMYMIYTFARFWWNWTHVHAHSFPKKEQQIMTFQFIAVGEFLRRLESMVETYAISVRNK
jgi:hypothetical protein